MNGKQKATIMDNIFDAVGVVVLFLAGYSVSYFGEYAWYTPIVSTMSIIAVYVLIKATVEYTEDKEAE